MAGAATAGLALAANGLAARAADSTWLVNTVAGNGIAGYAGDGGQAVNAELNAPLGVAVDNSGNIYFSDNSNDRVRKVATTGSITTIAGNGTFGYSGDGGPATAAELAGPAGIAIDSAGDIYIADENNHRIRKVDISGTMSTVAGNGQSGFGGDGGPATSAMLSFPYGVTVDSLGNVYIADMGNNRVRKVDTSRVITTMAGNGTAGFAGDGGLATAAELHSPSGVAVTSAGALYIADSSNNRVRLVGSSGIISTVAGGGVPNCVTLDGPANGAGIDGLVSDAVDSQGDLYLTSCNGVQEVDTAGNMTRVAGTGINGFAGDGGQAGSAEFSGPGHLAVATSGTIYVADSGNNRVREVHAPLVGETILIPVPGASVTIPGLPIPILGNVYASPDGMGGYRLVVTVDGTTLPAVDVFDDNQLGISLNSQIGGPTSPFTVGIAGLTLSVSTITVDAIIVGPDLCLLSVGGTCLAPVPLNQNNLAAGEAVAIQVCAPTTPFTCVTRNIPF